MRAESTLRKSVSHGSVVRGDAYFAAGRVRRVREPLEGVIEAQVQGSELYDITLEVLDDELLVSCDCPFFIGQGVECKHIWAAIRAASARGMLPDRDLYLVVNEDDIDPSGVYSDNVRRETRPSWQRFLDALTPSRLEHYAPAPRPIPDEIVYAVSVFPHAQMLALQLLSRVRRKNGEWGKWKSLSLRYDQLPSLQQFDRESIALLAHRTFSGNIESTIHVPPATSGWWIERLARAGKLRILDANDDPQPVAWDDGPPWKFRMAIVNDPAAARYRIAASVERVHDDRVETLPLEKVGTIFHDILITNGRASRFDDGGRAMWLHALRASGPIEIPHADTERFRTALLRTPIGDLALPEELGWEVATSKPVPVLALTHDGWSTELHGELLFDYDDWRVSSRSTEMQKTIGRKLLRRDRAAEDACRARLAAARVIAVSDGFRVRTPQLEEVARALTADGWRLEIDSAPVRVTDDVDVEISSGIDWFDLNVNASFGDVTLTLPELLAAAEAKRSMLRLSDGSYGIVPTSWTNTLAPVLELGKRDGDAVRFRPAQALLVDALLHGKARTADERFTSLREKIASATPAPRHEPPTLTTELRPYQRAGLGWLHFLRETSLGGCLADDMGLGKTVQTLALLEELRVSGSKQPSLVVAPRSLLFNWAAEARRFAPKLRVLEHHGSDRGKNAFGDYDVVLTTYATMRLDIERIAETEFEYVILDEAQAIKNASSQVAKASRQLRGKHRLALSGTPIENHLGELWSLFEFLDPGLLGSSRSFSRTFASKTVAPERREALARALRPLILRRTKEQVAPELPERIEQTLYCELEGKQKEQYDELRDHYRAALLAKVRKGGVEKSRMQILEALLRLRQAACDPALINPDTEAPSAKLELLMDELREVLDSGHRALVFSQFTSFLRIVRKALDRERTPYLYLDGSTQDRQSLVEQFQTAAGPPLFLISLKAGGLGLNLTSADYIFLLDPWWNPAVEAQAIDRAHRIGRQKPVVAYRLIARDTVEEKILELQARKRELADSIISEDNSVLRRLELEDLEMLLG